MGHSNGRIWKPVSIWDVVDTLHTNRQDIGAVCTSEQQKIWAKYKPIRHSTLGELSDDDRKGKGYGLTVPSVSGTTPLALIQYYDGEFNGWAFEKPRGGNVNPKEWYRLLDFDKYNANPSNPVINFNAISNLVFDAGQTSQPFFPASFIGGAADGSIELRDFAAVFNHVTPNAPIYFGCAFFKGANPDGASLVTLATADSPITKDATEGTYSGTTVSFAKNLIVSNLHKGVWTLVPFFTYDQITQEGAWSSQSQISGTHTFFPVPHAAVSQVDFQSMADTYTITFDGYRNLGLSSTITIKNNGSGAVAFTLSCYYWDSSIPGTPLTRSLQSHERQYTLTNQTVAAGGTFEWHLPTSPFPPAELGPTAVAYIWVSTEETIRGPFAFKAPLPEDA